MKEYADAGKNIISKSRVKYMASFEAIFTRNSTRFTQKYNVPIQALELEHHLQDLVFCIYSCIFTEYDYMLLLCTPIVVGWG